METAGSLGTVQKHGALEFRRQHGPAAVRSRDDIVAEQIVKRKATRWKGIAFDDVQSVFQNLMTSLHG
jgi:hypothetical protein